ncbi:TonB-dependent receptor [Flavobacterium wongokense]|uniref:TonB-dependent receptor n=1 Tax=Flavobacterium wongokense TaxID=2910674 RepID=UPI001F1AD308|nr:TonB-dependent receptor [Flavobacterium sp. WG47]MCF6132935.1 TonB-dependent receptor [Flavobacterium sp. WG47]
MQNKIILLLLLLATTLSFAQGGDSFGEPEKQKVTLSGTISDLKTNETLIGVNLFIPEIKAGIVTNEYGFYSLTIPKGTYTIQISYMGYETMTETIELTKDTKKNISLNETGQALEEVVINTEKTATNIRKPEMSVNRLSTATIKKIPVVLGEVDVLKAILTLPGVTNAGEGQSGFNVRGGGADQNLILLDEATIFNSSHVFGFFSVFNPDAIKDLKLYKGGIPARYGGRVSSVLDIYQKDGNSNKFSMNGGIGLISSRLLAEGPIAKGKGSFLLAGRGSYAHLFMKLADEPNSAYFYDLNTKVSYKLNPNNNLFLSGYFGRDVFSLNKSFINTYGNATLNLRWNHLFSDKLFSNLSTIYSDYYYGLDLNLLGFEWKSGIRNYNIKYDLRHYVSDKIKLNYGVNGIYYDFNPGVIEPSNENSGINYKQLEKKHAYESAFYIDAEQKVTKNLTLSYGLRFSKFYRLGSGNVNLYDNNQAVVFNEELQIYEKGTPIGTRHYGEEDVIKKFANLEPRFAASYQLNEDQSIKASYNRTTQYLQLVSNTASPTPLDVWTPSDNYIQPQIADQVALGYFKNFKDDEYSLEVETFYKKIKNRLDYIDGADLIANEALEQVVLNGQMRSYGLEVLLRKNTGKLTGWVSYTLSKSEQRTPGRTAAETGINNGEWYSSGHDKLHNLSVTSSYAFNKKWTFGANFVLQSGQPVTYPNGYYEYEGINVPSYGSRNADRLPAYHHLDLSATFTPKPNKKKGYQSEWVFSLYNVYGRQNAASISFGQNETTGVNEATRLSIFGIVPGVSYNFKF